MKLFSTFLLLGAMSFAQSTQEKLDRVFNGLGKPADPGFAVLIRDHGKAIYQRTVGITDLRTHAPLTPQTNFRLASCTKQFTAMSIMLLVHDGKLRYDDKLTDVLPQFDDFGKTITIRNLLNHTSGLPDYEDLMDKAEIAQSHGGDFRPKMWTSTMQISDAQVVALLRRESHGKFTPGTKWSYSNSGYVVLGAIVAKASGMTFHEFLHKRIFAPLRMAHTVVYVSGTNVVPNRAYGHTKASDAQRAKRLTADFTETDQSSTSATLGDGGVYSNLEDLAKWDDALANHTLLSEAEMRPALTPFKLPDGTYPKWSGDSGDEDPQHGKPVAYGFGWFLDPYTDPTGKTHSRMWHYGDTTGFKSAIQRFDDGLTVIVLCNRTDIDPAEVATRFANMLLTNKGY